MDDGLNSIPPAEVKIANHAQFTNLQKAEIIRSVEFFSEVAVEDLCRLAAIAQEVNYPARNVIYREEDVGDSMFLIVKGKVECVSEAKKLRVIVGAGQSVGVHSVLTREPQLATATALEDIFALALGAEDFYNLLATHPEIMAGLVKYFVKKVGFAP